ncbi:hypothetical protein [Chryseobacterium cucumeris]|uniref:hypothetical protein n=1 Tax=Chryseobacterium cucumeris TaxID=1813611 RepID=UPI001F4B6D9C|nr:hypothetical protein [Chryseobacterium cucumeris]
MSNTTNNNNYGIGLPAILGTTFIVLKLTKVIDWNWWWVTAPFWGAAALGLFILLMYGVILMTGLLFLYLKRKR